MKSRAASMGAVAMIAAVMLTPVAAKDLANESSVAWQKSQGLANWVPKGQRILFEAVGDLNKDGLDDAVILIGPMVPDEDGEPEPITAPMAGTGPAYQYEPRRLIVLLSQPSGGLRKVFESTKVIPPARSRDDNCLEDPAEEGAVKIDRGSLVITLNAWRSCGGWGANSTSTRFRLEGDRFKLIGMDTSEMSRATGHVRANSYNFITGKLISSERDIEEDSPPKQRAGVITTAKSFYLGDAKPDCAVDLKRVAASCK